MQSQFIPEIQTAKYPQKLSMLAQSIPNALKATNRNAERCQIILSQFAFQNFMTVATNRVQQLAQQEFDGPGNDDRVHHYVNTFDLALHACMVSQLANTRQGTAMNMVKKSSHSNPINTQPTMFKAIGHAITNLGDFEQTTGKSVMVEDANAEIMKISTNAMRLAMTAYGPDQILENTNIRTELLQEIITNIMRPQIVNGAVLDEPADLFSGDLKGRRAIKLHVGRSYQILVNAIPMFNLGVGQQPYHAFPQPMEMVNVRRNVEDWMMTNLNPDAHWVMRDGRQMPSTGQVADMALRSIMGDDAFNELGRYQPVNGGVGEILDQLRGYFTVLAYEREANHQIFDQIMEHEGLRMVPNLTIDHVFQAINGGIAQYNDKDAPIIDSLVKSESYIFAPTSGGTPAMLIRQHEAYPIDDHIAIYKAPYGVTKAHQLYGFMLQQTEDVKYNKVTVKVNVHIDYVRSAYFESFDGFQK